MDLRMFAACLIMTVFLIKHSDAAAITAWTFTDAAGTGATDTGTAPMGVTTVSIAESTAVGGTLFTALATPNTATYAFDTTDGNPSDIATATISAAGVVTLASSFDFETTPSYVFKIVATDGADTGTATVTLSITDAVQLTKTAFCLSSSSVAAGTSVGTITTDETAVTFGAPLTADFASFTVSTTTGAITVATGVTLSSAKQVYYTFTMTATATGVGASGTQNIYVLVNCDSDSSGAGQVAALFSMLLLSIATALLY